MTKTQLLAAAALFVPLALAQPALAATGPQFGDPVQITDALTFDPMLNARLRWEDVDAAGKTADAVTLRVRAGFEIKDTAAHLALLAEAVGTLAIDTNYNAFPFAASSHQIRSGFATVPDPQNVALNRLQLQYKTNAMALTLGRQRINLDDERWVGSVGWRQNEQTFDAIRSESAFGPLTVDTTYAYKVRTIFGNDSGPRVAYQGRFGFFNVGLKTGPLETKGFLYSLNYDPTSFGIQTNSSQTLGLRSTLDVKLSPAIRLVVAASYAHQNAIGSAPVRYGADYISLDGALNTKAWTFRGGYEVLGSDASVAGGKSLQTPFATLHKFNGWADVFLTTPARGLTDAFAGATYRFVDVPTIPGLNAQLIYHQFDAETGRNNYGHEWDAAVGLKTGKISWMAKYADYTALGFGANTTKFWLQAEYGF